MLANTLASHLGVVSAVLIELGPRMRSSRDFPQLALRLVERVLIRCGTSLGVGYNRKLRLNSVGGRARVEALLEVARVDAIRLEVSTAFDHRRTKRPTSAPIGRQSS